MHIWAGSGSSSNGKDTVRRKTRTPKKTAKSLRKRKSSAKIGLGLDGSYSNEEVVTLSACPSPSPSPSPSPRRDSGLGSEMESEDSIHTITPYDVEENIVKPLNVGSLDSDLRNVDTTWRFEDDLKKFHEKKMDKDLHDGLDFSTPTKSKGKDVTLIDSDDANEESLDDFSSSFIGVGHMIAGKRQNERQTRDSDGDVFISCSQVGIKKMSPKDLPRLNTVGLRRDEHLDDDIKSVDNSLGVSQDDNRDTILDFSKKVPDIIREVEQSLSTSPLRFCRSDAPSPNLEVLGEATSLKEIEFCASGLKDHSADKVERSLALEGSEVSLDGSAQIEDGNATASLEGFSSNLGSPLSLLVIGNNKVDPFAAKDGTFISSSNLSVSGSVETENKYEYDEKSLSIQGNFISSPESRHRKLDWGFSDVENDEALPSYKENCKEPVVEFDDDRDIASSEQFSPVNKGVILSMTPKHSGHYTIKGKGSKPSTSHHASIFSSLGPDYAETLDGNEPEESLIVGERSRGIEVEIDEKERRYLPEMGRKMRRKNPELLGPMVGENERGFMGTSQDKVDEAKTICHLIPQMDGSDLPPLPAVDPVPVERIWSPSPRKRLQKVNRSKSPSSTMKSSSSSLRRRFQDSRTEGMEGEIRHLRIEVGQLKNTVDELAKEFKEVRIKEEKGCETVVRMDEKIKGVWAAMYGKGWDGEKVDEDGEDWKDREEVGWTREVRDVGLLRVVGRMKRERDEERKEHDENHIFLKDEGIEPYEMDLMLPIPTEPESKSTDKGKDKGKGKEVMITNHPIPSEEMLDLHYERKSSQNDVKTFGDIASRDMLESGLGDEGKGLNMEYRVEMDEGVGFESEFEDGNKLTGEKMESIGTLLGLNEPKRNEKKEILGNIAQVAGAEIPPADFTSKARLKGMPSSKGKRKGKKFDQEIVDKWYNEERGSKVAEEDKPDWYRVELEKINKDRKVFKHFRGEGKPHLEFNYIDYKTGNHTDIKYIDQHGDFMDRKEAFNEKQKDVMRDPKGINIEERGRDASPFFLQNELLEEAKFAKRVEDSMRDLLKTQEAERRADLEEIKRLGGMVEELRGLVLKGNRDSKKEELEGVREGTFGCGCGSGSGSGKAGNVANMRERDVCGYGEILDGDGDGDSEEEVGDGDANVNANGKSFWDWVGGGILWRQD
ncbi:hypothetical protein NHQ30_010054 [Ciborinia camelliae]|nr:hypothetical protein NHQ30_010054 [Ciborinia camelliae]